MYLVTKKIILAFLSICLSVSLCLAGQHNELKYIFLFIGDGMGTNQRLTADYYKQAIDTGNAKKVGDKLSLSMNKLPVHGIMTTHPSDAYITDSAAAGTAMACGQRVRRLTLGVDDTNKPIKNITEILRHKGWKIGILTTTAIDHSTPAAFYAHQSDRGKYYEIFQQMLSSGFEYFASGYSIAAINDNFNAFELAEKAGYKVCRKRDELKTVSDDKVWVCNPNWGKAGAMPFNSDRTKIDFTLAEYVENGIRLLTNDKGFFMMIEGGKIDWACHHNDAYSMVSDIIGMDQAVDMALNFYHKHLNETLIIVTADHETGGMAMGGRNDYFRPAKLKGQIGSAERFEIEIEKMKEKGADFNKIVDKTEKWFGIEDLTEYEINDLKTAYELSSAGEIDESMPKEYRKYAQKNPYTVTAFRIFSERAGISWGSVTHTATPVMVTAIGIGAERFCGLLDITEIYSQIFSLVNGCDSK
ncbi:MAG: hypothetical protein A2Y10_06180 [Planctomycetes bacterium GWF2_41_51]|nr:MAG: hypothetical protein A2Y10_06180 [Planctomycetes bacterium GWF2_41_51]